MPLPFGNTNGAMSLLWQARAGMYFRMASGYFGYTPPDYGSPLLPALLGGPIPAQAPQELRSFITAHGVRHVLVDPFNGPRWPAVLKRDGLRPVKAGGMLIYRVPDAWIAQAS